MKWFTLAVLVFLIVSKYFWKYYLLNQLLSLQNAVRSDEVQQKCENEATELKDTPLHDKFVEHCVDSGTWSKTKEEVDKVWEECKTKSGYTSNDECLSRNMIHRDNMLAQYDCFDEAVDPEKNADNNVYRWAVVDLAFYKSTPAKLYKKYAECLEKHPVTTSNTIEFINCYSEKVDKEHLELVTRNWVIPSKDEIKDNWKNCESLVTPEVLELINKGDADEESVPFLKCVAEKAKVVVKDCFYVERDIEINKRFSEKDNTEEIKKCYKNAVGKEKIDGAKYFKCIWSLFVI